MTQFSTKWGLQKEELCSRQLQTIVSLQFVVTLVLLVLIRPKFLLSHDTPLHVPRLSLPKATVVAAAVVTLTYGYPQLVR